MTGSGIFPKIDGDILYAHDVNSLAGIGKTMELYTGTAFDSTATNAGSLFSFTGSFIPPGSIGNLYNWVAIDTLLTTKYTISSFNGAAYGYIFHKYKGSGVSNWTTPLSGTIVCGTQGNIAGINTNRQSAKSITSIGSIDSVIRASGLYWGVDSFCGSNFIATATINNIQTRIFLLP